MDIINKFNKAIDLLKTKYLMKFKQKTYMGSKYKINYLLEKNSKSKDLLIVFSACTKIGQKARYNYIRTLDEFKCNKLYILDDFGFDGRGAYYLGKDKDFMIEKDVIALINKVSTEINPEKRNLYWFKQRRIFCLIFWIRKKK